MHAMAALLAAGHLQDLLREAEDERRRDLVRSARPRSSSRTFTLRRRITWVVRRLRGDPAGTNRPEPAGA